jgi:hypothetical protein
MATYDDIPAQVLRRVANDPSATGPSVVVALRAHLEAQIKEYRAGMERSLDTMHRALGREDVDLIKSALDDHNSAHHLCLELEDLLGLLEEVPVTIS